MRSHLTRGPAHLPLLAALLLSALVGSSCRSTDPAFYDSEDRRLEDLPPALYSVAVAPLDLAGGSLDGSAADGRPLHFSLTAEQLQQELVDVLTSLDAASAVYAVGASDLAEAKARRADLLVRPRLRQPAEFERVGKSKRALTAGLFWITTWIGGFFVEDTKYDAGLALDFDIVNPHDNLRIDSVAASSDVVDLSFLDRNSFFSWGTLQSVVLPPFWTTAQKEKTSARLSEIASARLAARLTLYLKEGLPATERDYLGEVRLESPRNGAVAGSVTPLKGKVVAQSAITDLAVYLNDSDTPIFEMTGDQLPSAAEQRRGNLYQVFFDRLVELQSGKNLIGIELGISGQTTSRTVVVHSGTAIDT